MLKQSHAISEELIEWRRDFHMHPELGFELHRTSKIVADEMEKMGYRVRRGVGKTGVVAEIGEGGKVIAIRADMDALPILEMNETEYVSQNKGAMHACGHDSHTAMALGAALLLTKEKLPGRVRFLFQPCEETTDAEGLSGAQRMSAEGAMDGVDYVIAQHVDPSKPVGKIGITAGPASGGVDSWYAVIKGKGGHGAHPNKTIDPFYLLAHVIMALNGIVSRRLDPFEPAVVSIGSISGGFTENVGEIERTLGAEDFGEFMKHAPGAMFTLGTQKEGHEEYLLHHPKFDIDERALPIGTAMLAEAAKRFLQS